MFIDYLWDTILVRYADPSFLEGRSSFHYLLYIVKFLPVDYHLYLSIEPQY